MQAGDHPHQLRRRLDRALIGGVCAGIADYLGVEPLLARAGMLVIAGLSGIGFALYPLAWALIPATGHRPESWRTRLTGWREAVAIAILTAGAVVALRWLGLWLGDAVVWPLITLSCGLALVLRQVTAPEWLSTAAPSEPDAGGLGAAWRRWPAGVLGTVLVFGAAVAFLRTAGILTDSGKVFLGTAVLVVALALVVAPYLLGLARKLTSERLQRIRSEERAEMGAHLHDSVLQTLALIQRRADDPAQVVGLARSQERELRDWLLARDGTAGPPTSLRAGLEQVAQETEATHAVRVETVVVGDCPLDERLQALIAAAREALVNAAKFAGAAQINIYAEAGEERVEVFVRDRGTGFDPEAIPGDRQGIRLSIRERMARHGGMAHVRSTSGQGTEVELIMERAAA
ncbi:MAG TPA: PspC domain-containing protein [Solirubrobacteraceae bacterium]|nr:PspC domain-containing protein [Solirubrobacteraceae bacterium]